jgi:Trypsin-like peptidase domain
MSNYTIDLTQPGSHYLLATVRVDIHYANNQSGSGTAFFFRYGNPTISQNTYLVTNNHVIDGALSISLRFHSGGNNEPSQFRGTRDLWITLPNPTKHWVSHPDPEVDLCAISYDQLKNIFPEAESIYFTSVSSTDILTAEEEGRFPSLTDIAMIGYPIGLWDEKNNLPVQRKGTTATHPAVDFDGRAEVLVDMACFPGSSGSPVVFHDLRYFGSATRFLGVLYAGPLYTADGKLVPFKVPTKLGQAVEVQTMMHLGYVIKARKVVELVEFMEAQIDKP